MAAKMSEGEVATVTGAAGGTGLAATELSLSRHHPVCCWDANLKVDCMCSPWSTAKGILEQFAA